MSDETERDRDIARAVLREIATDEAVDTELRFAAAQTLFQGPIAGPEEMAVEIARRIREKS